MSDQEAHVKESRKERRGPGNLQAFKISLLRYREWYPVCRECAYLPHPCTDIWYILVVSPVGRDIERKAQGVVIPENDGKGRYRLRGAP